MPYYEHNLRNCPKHSVRETLEIFEKLLQTVRSLEGTIYHGNIKPEKIFISKTADGKPQGLLAGWGSAEWGTTAPGYKPPEYFQMPPIFTSVDAWSIMVCLLEALTPEDRKSFFPPRSTWTTPYLTGSEAPQFIQDLLARALDPNPQTRMHFSQVVDLFAQWKEEMQY